MTDRTRTASSVGTSEASAQNPVDRQVGEARERIARIVALGLSMAEERPDTDPAAARWLTDAIHADLEQVTRERDEAVRLSSEMVEAWDWWQVDTYDRCQSVPQRGIDDLRTFLASLRSMEKTGG